MKNTCFIENKIKDIINKKNIDINMLCKKLGINSNKFQGKSKLNSSEFISLCLFLKLNLKDFMKGENYEI